jgi:hypothetical protein
VLEVGLSEEGCHNAVLHKNQHYVTLEVALGYAKNLSLSLSLSLSLFLPSILLQMAGCGTL